LNPKVHNEKHHPEGAVEKGSQHPEKVAEFFAGKTRKTMRGMDTQSDQA
jgi:hypothetical protein